MINDVEGKIESMGLVLKPSKCRSLSISSGKSIDNTFTIKNPENGELVTIKSILEESHE